MAGSSPSTLNCLTNTRKEDRIRKIYHGPGNKTLYLDGYPSTPKNIAKACQIAENGGYMRDYISDEKGQIARVNFDFVEEK